MRYHPDNPPPESSSESSKKTSRKKSAPHSALRVPPSAFQSPPDWKPIDLDAFTFPVVDVVGQASRLSRPPSKLEVECSMLNVPVPEAPPTNILPVTFTQDHSFEVPSSELNVECSPGQDAAEATLWELAANL